MVDDSDEDVGDSWGKRAVKSIFGLDTRSLAAFRVALGLILLVDLYVRWGTMADFQTDQGALSRSTLVQFFLQGSEPLPEPLPEQPLPNWSLHLLSGSLWFQQTLAVVGGVAAVALLCGWFTRTATFIAWVLLISLHVRNPIVLNSGDTLLRMLLFWSLFLPLGARWSFDRLVAGPSKPIVSLNLSVAGAALILQLCFMYWFTGISKFNDVWFSGQAIRNVLETDLLTRPWGKRLLAYPELLDALSMATVWGELLLPCLLFVPFRTHWFRLANIVIFTVFHLGILFSISVGLFSAVSIAAWLALIPREFWNSTMVTGFLGRFFGSGALVGDEDLDGSSATGDDEPEWKQRTRWVVQGIVGLLLVYVLLWNVSRIRPGAPTWERFMPPAARGLGASLLLAQEFKMFDFPPARDYWFVYEGRLRNGDVVDLFTGKPAGDQEKPRDLHSRYRDHRWRRLHANLLQPEYQMLREPLTDFMVRRWNETHSEQYQVVQGQLKFFQRHTDSQTSEDHITGTTWTEVKVEGEDPTGNLLESLQDGGRLLP